MVKVVDCGGFGGGGGEMWKEEVVVVVWRVERSC
jgi:hypothetical protein